MSTKSIETQSESDLVTLDLGGCQIGSAALPEKPLTHAVPDVELFRELVATMRRQSAILAMKKGEIPGKSVVYEAYAKDLELLGRYQHDFQTCVREAIRCSIASAGRPQSKRWRKVYEVLATRILPMDVQPICLPSTLASKPLNELVDEITVEMNCGIDRAIRSLAGWLQLLVEEELIGVVKWSGSDLDVCCYSYFRQELDIKTAKGKRRREITTDPTKPYGQQIEERILRDRTTTTRQISERHVHHIVNAEIYRLSEYPHPVPSHVAKFLNQIPESLTPHFHIVEGTITTEERHRRVVKETTTTETEILSVYKYSPGITFGPFNLTGWSADDLKQGAVLTAAQRRRQRKEKVSKLAGHLFTP